MQIETLSFEGTFEGNTVCFWEFEDVGDQDVFFIGQPFLSQYYTVFDAEE
jgi:hypothetical protein